VDHADAEPERIFVAEAAEADVARRRELPVPNGDSVGAIHREPDVGVAAPKASRFAQSIL
jgi:hypothetical protein